MAIRKKIDSNETGAAFAEEVLGTPGVLPVTPDWYPLEPNSYDDFGGEYELIARRPINSSRQRKKGSITDLDANGGFNQDLTQTNTQRLLQGFMYASYRRKAEAIPSAFSATGVVVPDETLFKANDLVFISGSAVAGNNGFKLVTSIDAGTSEVRFAGAAIDAAPDAEASVVVVGYQGAAGVLDVVTTGAYTTITSSGVDFTTLGLIPGELIFIGGDSAGFQFANAVNNGLKRIKSVSAGALVIDKSAAPMVAETSTTETVRLFFGRVLKNELAALQVRRSYNLERALGVPDPANPSETQAEYLIGAHGNELTVHIEQADKINVDFSFVALDSQQRGASLNLKTGNRKTILEADAYNTSTDFTNTRLAIVSPTGEAPDPLFGFFTESSIMINNNVSVNKAVGILGGFDVTLGLFEVSMEVTAYFSTVEAVAAIRNNSDVTYHTFVAKNNAGFAIDIPLVSLGNGRLEVEIDEPVMLPLSVDAATAARYGLDHTILWMFFDYLPTLAEG